MGKNYVGDIGTDIILNAGSDISLSTTSNILVEKTDGTEEIWVGSVYNSNYVKFTTVEGSLDQAGIYSMNVYVIMASGTFTGETFKRRIFDKYE